MTRLDELLSAEQEGEGICLECGEIQPFLERRMILGLCHECGEHEVVEAGLVVRMIERLELLDNEGEKE